MKRFLVVLLVMMTIMIMMRGCRFYIVEDGELKAEIAGVEGEVCDRLRQGEGGACAALLPCALR